jgi:hypothetical protein
MYGINIKSNYPLMKDAMPYSKKSANRKCSSIQTNKII